jgi:hypothetical protein
MLFELSAIVRAAGCVAQPATSIAETAIIIISLFMVLNVCKGERPLFRCTWRSRMLDDGIVGDR